MFDFSDVHPAASLTVSPDRVQHFTSESVSLKCDGNSAEWRMMSFTETGDLSECSNWGTTNGSACTISIYWYHSGVFWCESGSGEFSNAINITAQSTLSFMFFSSIFVLSTSIIRDEGQMLQKNWDPHNPHDAL